MIRIEREDNGHSGRFVLYENNVFAGELIYTWSEKNIMIINHTEVEEVFGGKGYGKKLLMDAVAFARANTIKILPYCPFAKPVFEKNPDIQDVLY